MNLREQTEATLFQPVDGGYVYREPYRWPFVEAPHYLVNEDQKAALAAVVIPRRPVLWQVVMWSTLVLMVALACVGAWLYTGHESPTVVDGFAMILLTVGEIAVGLAILFWWKRRQVRPLLANLPRTELRITQAQIRAAAANAMPDGQIRLAAIAGVFASLAMLVNAGLQLAWHNLIGLFWLSGSLIFAGVAWYYFRLLISRSRTRH